MVQLVYIETSGNQPFIFDSNKRRENVVASQLIDELSTKWLRCTLSKHGVADSIEQASESKRIESGKPEVIVAASGKVLLVVPDGAGEDIIASITTSSLEEAPGLDVCGVVSKPFEWGSSCGLQKADKEVHALFQQVHSRIPGPALRGMRLPIIAPCSTTGLAASVMDNEGEGGDSKSIDLSASSYAKRKATERAYRRLADKLKDLQFSEEQLRKIADYLGDKAEWVGLIHADGNGFGAIFSQFEKALPEDKREDDRAYADTLRGFSKAIDDVAYSALKDAIKAVEPFAAKNEKITVPSVLPLIVGGDDITVLCDGSFALVLAVEILRNFEKFSSKDPCITDVLQNMNIDDIGPKRLSACAGVTLIKSHYPFSTAYHLTEQLTTATKKEVKRVMVDDQGKSISCSALDFHVTYDTGEVDLDSIRAHLTEHGYLEENGTLHIIRRPDGVRSQPGAGRSTLTGVTDYIATLHARPYVVTPLEDLTQATQQGKDWAKRHQWEKLCERVEALQDKDEDGHRKLPSSQVHALRSAMYIGSDIAEPRFSEMRKHYGQAGIDALGECDGQEYKLYWDDPPETDGKKIKRSALIDAMDAANCLPLDAAKRYIKVASAGGTNEKTGDV